MYTGRHAVPHSPTHTPGHHEHPVHRASHPHHARRARAPPAASGLTVARRRVRETPWDSEYWTELADLLFKRGEFDLATRAYRRVQELCGPTVGSRRGDTPTGGRSVPWIGPGRQVVAPPSPPSPPSPPPGSPPRAKEPEQHAPILRSDSGRTRAIRLKDSNLYVALTLEPDEAAPAPTPPSSSAAHPLTGRPKGPATKATADEKLRSVMQKDLERLLRLFNKDTPTSSSSSSSSKGEEDEPSS